MRIRSNSSANSSRPTFGAESNALRLTMRCDLVQRAVVRPHSKYIHTWNDSPERVTRARALVELNLSGGRDGSWRSCAPGRHPQFSLVTGTCTTGRPVARLASGVQLWRLNQLGILSEAL